MLFFLYLFFYIIFINKQIKMGKNQLFISLTLFTPVVLSKNNKILIIVNLAFHSFFLRTTGSTTLLSLVTRKLDSRRTQQFSHVQWTISKLVFKIYQMRWHIRVKEKFRFIIVYNKMANAYLKCKHFQKVGNVNKVCRQWNVTCIIWSVTA
jgi:hypothetical protein